MPYLVPKDARAVMSIHVLVYQTSQRRLARADVPLWFLRIRGPALECAFRGTGFDIRELGLAASDLERYGACLLIDETRDNGDRLLVWTD